MDRYSDFKNELMQIRTDVAGLLDNASTLPGADRHSFDNWKKTCSDIGQQIAENMVRIAVVGAIKSGKSTFVNSLLRGDYLKRGAGVVTSMVTRIRSSEASSAKLWFKSWDDVNADMKAALILFPDSEWRSSHEQFDIRNDSEREELEKALHALSTDLLISTDTRNMNSVLISSYLKGYQRVKDIISEDRIEREYPFAEHREFVSDDALSVYLRDIQLEVINRLDRDIEIADCQGSDSPNPMHLAMIQEYLLRTHLLLYVISARTGLRQADIRFLNMIRNMGILENIVFIINIDFGEHESPEECRSLIGKISEELALLKSHPQIYSFSALFNLFRSQPDQLSSRNRSRFEQWAKETEFVDFSDKETQRFDSDFTQKLREERYALLLRNHAERLSVICSGLAYWSRLHQDMLVQSSKNAEEFVETVRRHQEKVNQVKGMIHSTLEGTLDKIKTVLKSDVDGFFDTKYGELFQEVLGFIRNFSVVNYELYITSPRFSNALYLLFQDFKHSVDTFMAETVNPKVISFVRDQEKKIAENLQTIGDTYSAMIHDAMTEYHKEMESFVVSPMTQIRFRMPDAETVRSRAGIVFSQPSVAMQYGFGIKSSAIMRLGMYAVMKKIKGWFVKKSKQDRAEQVHALKYGLTRLKKETEASLQFQFKNYRENLKYQYIFALAEAFCESLYQALTDHFGGYVTDISKSISAIHDKQSDKEHLQNFLKKIEDIVGNTQERLKRLKLEMS